MITLHENIQLTKNFTIDEFANHLTSGTVVKIDLDLVDKLQSLRDIVGSIDITSGYRTPDFNASVGGSSNSYHLEGLAADFRFDFTGFTVTGLKRLLSGLGFINIGIYLKGNMIDRLHCDIGVRWAEKNGWQHYKNSAFKIYQI